MKKKIPGWQVRFLTPIHVPFIRHPIVRIANRHAKFSYLKYGWRESASEMPLSNTRCQQRSSSHSKNKYTSRIEIFSFGHNNTLGVEKHRGTHTHFAKPGGGLRQRDHETVALCPPWHRPRRCFGLTITYVLFFLSCATFVNR